MDRDEHQYIHQGQPVDVALRRRTRHRSGGIGPNKTIRRAGRPLWHETHRTADHSGIGGRPFGAGWAHPALSAPAQVVPGQEVSGIVFDLPVTTGGDHRPYRSAQVDPFVLLLDL